MILMDAQLRMCARGGGGPARRSGGAPEGDRGGPARGPAYGSGQSFWM